MRNTFTPAYLNIIAEQQRDGIICAECGKTKIEHTFSRGNEKVCGHFDDYAFDTEVRQSA